MFFVIADYLDNNRALNPEDHNDVLTLSEIIVVIDKYLHELINKKWWIVRKSLYLATLVLLGYGVFKVIELQGVQKSMYANTTSQISTIQFVVKEHSIDKTGEISVNKIPLSEIWSINDNLDIIDQALFVESEYTGEFIANDLILEYNLANIWDNELVDNYISEYSLKDFKFSHNEIHSFDQKETRALYTIRNVLLGKDISKLTFENYRRKVEKNVRENNIINASKGTKYREPNIVPVVGTISSPIKIYGNENIFIESISSNRTLSIDIAQNIFDKIKEIFTIRKKEITNNSLSKLQLFKDSLLSELILSKEDRDQAYNDMKGERQRIVRQLLQSQIQLEPDQLMSKDLVLTYDKLNSAYEAKEREFKQLETIQENIKFKLNNQSTEFQILDRSFVPNRVKPQTMIGKFIFDLGSIIKYFVFGFICGLMLFSFYILYNKLVSDANIRVTRN